MLELRRRGWAPSARVPRGAKIYRGPQCKLPVSENPEVEGPKEPTSEVVMEIFMMEPQEEDAEEAGAEEADDGVDIIKTKT